jgi:hypothetical protein
VNVSETCKECILTYMTIETEVGFVYEATAHITAVQHIHYRYFCLQNIHSGIRFQIVPHDLNDNMETG